MTLHKLSGTDEGAGSDPGSTESAYNPVEFKKTPLNFSADKLEKHRGDDFNQVIKHKEGNSARGSRSHGDD
ncbi:hypothetical protein KOW79_020225 [Hemibagrus wyckioides]|uniref:Uncharacterized protein n=1 Tax=Hemibagrus wyckioides TaxID=337641 RepID=A0A9D3SF69_9TELE|nr:hypothetical protein KOW79_020225 [Hemibagrus wyckioides]